MSSIETTLRPVQHGDAPGIERVFTLTRAAAVPHMPPPVHTAAENAAFFERRCAEAEVWVACRDGEIVGYLDLDLPDAGGWVNALYVLPEYAGAGLGSALLDLAKARRPDGFALWVFVSNEPARRFYRRHGLVELEHTDGADNEEKAPDLRMAWPGEQAVAYLRARIDEIDAELAPLLARRAALTAAIQPLKAVPGQAGRDPQREAAIAHRMSRRAPSLDEDTWRRLVDAIIGISLDAAEGR